jgi:dethiobiotin synthetase
MASQLARGVFVTGTDTGVGKTEIACGLVRAFAAMGRTVIGMKPVAAGARRIGGQLRNSDVECLIRDANVKMPRRILNPYIFSAAIAPHIAAERAGTEIELSAITTAYDQLARRAQIVVVEGVGGFLVPLNSRYDTGELARRLALPVVLVVGMRLGCLSHALLTTAAIASRGINLAGWVANRVDPRMRAYRENLATLKARLPAPLVGEIAFRPHLAERRRAIDRALQASHLIGRMAAPG